MSRLVAKLLLAMLMMPAGVVVYLILFQIFYRSVSTYRYEMAWTIATIGTWLFTAGYWFALWRGQVIWSRQRIRHTVLATVGAIVVGTGVGYLIGASTGSDFQNFLAGLSSIILALICSVLVWRETPAERAARFKSANADALVCPSCGYNLTGLTTARCPECGTQYTLNELLAAQPAKPGGELAD